MIDDDMPVYTIGTTAEILQVHPRTLRLYEAGGLLRPARKGNRRLYSNNDLRWIKCVRYLIHKRGLNLEGLRRLLALIPCWEVRGCSQAEREACGVYQDLMAPCWEIASRTCAQDKKCYQCEVYLQARRRVLDEEGLKETEALQL